MVTETITDYEVETKEVEREVMYSDLSGREIPDGDEVSLPVNPKLDTQDIRHGLKQVIIDQGEKEHYANALADLVVENMDSPRAVCEGRIHLHVNELAELNGIDPDDIDADSELPEWYVKKQSPEVVDKSWINLDSAKWVILVLLSFGTSGSLAYFEYARGLLDPAQLGFVVASWYVLSMAMGSILGVLLVLIIAGILAETNQ